MSDQDWTDELKEFADLQPRRSLAVEAADSLREFILLGKLAPGLPVRERELSEAFGISRTPLKEALRILEREGLIEYSATRRPHVADPSLEKVLEWLQVQGALEALGGELSCRNASDQQIADIEALNARFVELRKGADSLATFRCDMKFHTDIVAGSGNQALIETHAMYNARLWRVRFLSSELKVGIKTTQDQHNNITEGLKARNSKATAKALRQHLKSAEKNIITIFGNSRST